MTREEATTVLKAFMENPLFSDVHKAAFNIAIHDIKQRHEWDINNLILINKDNYESQEPKTGHWIYNEEYSSWYDTTYECPHCKRAIIVPYEIRNEVYKEYPYCHCGARMIEPQESEEE